MIKWIKEPQTYGGNIYRSSDGNFVLRLSNYHPTAKYAHNMPNKLWWTLDKKDTAIGVAPDYMVQFRSFESLARAKAFAEQWAEKLAVQEKVREAYAAYKQTGSVSAILLEGGNVFDDVTEFKHESIGDILAVINDALSGTGINIIPVGSGATPTPGKISGDLDVMADEKEVMEYFKAKDAKTARAALKAYIESKGLKAAQTGINVHVRVPVGGEAHQVDIMVSPNAERIAKLHIHDIPKGSPYKGVNKHLLIAILAKSKGLMWSPWQGLFQRTPEGKKGEFLSSDLDAIAKAILSPKATAKNLGSVEAILKSLPAAEAKLLLAKAKEDPNWK